MEYVAVAVIGVLLGALGLELVKGAHPLDVVTVLRALIYVAASGIAAAGVFAAIRSLDWSFGATTVDYIAVTVIGALIGVTELVARYRDAPLAALLTFAAVFYVAVNAGASAAALGLVEVFNWNFGQATGTDGERWIQVLVAGLGAVALFRSSLFLVRVGETDVGVGPSSLLQVLLAAADRAVDRKRADARAKAIGPLMTGVSFEKARTALPTFCLALMQNVPIDEQEDVGRDLKELETDEKMSDEVKVLNLGLRLMNVVGSQVLQAAVASLGSRIGESNETFPGDEPTEDVAPGTPASTELADIPPSPGGSEGKATPGEEG